MKQKPNINLDRKILGEPYPLEMSGMAERARRNLLIGCGIALIILIGGLEISEDSAFLGIKFENLSSQTIYWALTVFIGYELVHFCWLTWNQLAYWRVRLTGVKVVFQTNPAGAFAGGRDEPKDYPENEKQSSLTNWWLEHSRGLESVPSILTRLENELKIAEKDNEHSHSRIELSKAINKLSDLLENSKQSFLTRRIQKSLVSFDKWYALLISSQGYRWLVLEVGLPILLALISVSGLIYKIVYCS